jgi:hypothetical protein
MVIDKYLNRWVTCKTLFYKDEFQVIDNLELVHPSYHDFVKQNRIQTIYKCIGIDADYLIIRSRSFDLKVKPDAIHSLLPTPAFEWGSSVQEVSRPEIKGVIEDLIWHQNKQDFLYYLSVGGKRKTRQYQANELKSEV